MRLTAVLVLGLVLLTAGSLPLHAATGVQTWGPEGPESLAVPHAELLRAQSGRLVDDGSTWIQERRLAGEKAPGTLNVILMRADFSDSLMLGRYGEVPGDFPPPAQSEIYFTAHDSVFFDYLMGKVRDYYTDVSGGALTIEFTIHPQVVNLPQPMSYYGNHPENGEQPVVLADAVVRALDDDIDFSQYDTFVLVHAGAGEETDVYGQNPEQIFSTYLDPDDFRSAYDDGHIENPFIPSGDFPDSNGIDRVLILPECEHQDPIGFFGSLGVYCFEFGLHLGMLSLSDFTPAGRPDSQGIGEFGLMGYGLFAGSGFVPPHPVAFNKLLMGWIDPYPLDAASPVTGQLTPSERPGEPLACARVAITGQEYWLLSYRLQDRDGNRIFSFPDDKNGNNVPDFWDADSPTGDGVPVWGAKFDVTTDSMETLGGSEWDFFMSEWTDTQQGVVVKGTGSGVYVWHIDEGVVADVFDAESNLFNADPDRKSVDLEEADRIQDLDSNQASTHMLGWDQDNFRGEGASAFGPQTLPPTDTAGGAATGISFRNFSNVVADSMAYPLYLVGADTVWGLEYADTMSFELSTSIDPGDGPVVAARGEFAPGTDLRGSHVLVSYLDGPQAQGQIVLGANGGQVFVLEGDLGNYLPGGAPGVIEPFAVGMHAGTVAEWNLPPAVGDVDHDGDLDIVLTGADGIYAFNKDGTPVRDLQPGDHGFYVGMTQCALPAILIPADFQNTGADTLNAAVCTVDRSGGHSILRFHAGPDATAYPERDLGPVVVPSVPVLLDDLLIVAVADTVAGTNRIEIHDMTPSVIPEEPIKMHLELGIEPGPHAPTVGLVPDSDPDEPVFFIMVTNREGQGETVFFEADLLTTYPGVAWSSDVEVHSALAPMGTFLGDGIMGRVGHGGDWLTGWPRTPSSPIGTPVMEWAASPLVAHLPAAEPPLDQYLFQVPDGRLYAYSTQGEPVAGWPLGGPASSAGSPALGRIVAGTMSDLVAIGTFDRITGLDGEDGALTTEPLSAVTVWQDVAESQPLWPMWGGGGWRNGTYELGASGSTPGVASGTGLVSGSHICYPSPVLDGNLKVRAQVRAAARVRVFVYNLEGELVTSTGWREVVAVDPFDVEVDLGGAVSGLYLCRLSVETDGVGTEQSVVQFAVVR